MEFSGIEIGGIRYDSNKQSFIIDITINEMERNKVYEAIDSERDYQEEMTKRDDRPDMIDDLHIGDTITAIQYNLNKAQEQWYIGSVPHQEAIKYLRKIAALCVKAGESYGMPKRV